MPNERKGCMNCTTGAADVASTQGTAERPYVHPEQCRILSQDDAIRRPCMPSEYEYLHPTDHRALRLRVYIDSSQKQLRLTISRPRTRLPPYPEPGAGVSDNTESPASSLSTEGTSQPLVAASRKRGRRRPCLRGSTVFCCPLCCPSCTLCPSENWAEIHEHYTTQHWEKRRILGHYTIFPCGSCCKIVNMVNSSKEMPESAFDASGLEPMPENKSAQAIEQSSPPKKRRQLAKSDSEKGSRPIEATDVPNGDISVNKLDDTVKPTDTCWGCTFLIKEDDEVTVDVKTETKQINLPTKTSDQSFKSSDNFRNAIDDEVVTPTTNSSDAEKVETQLYNSIAKCIQTDTKLERAPSEMEKTSLEPKAKEVGIKRKRHGFSLESLSYKTERLHYHCPAPSCCFLSSAFDRLEAHCREMHSETDMDPRRTPANTAYAPFVTGEYFFRDSSLCTTKATTDETIMTSSDFSLRDSAVSAATAIASAILPRCLTKLDVYKRLSFAKSNGEASNPLVDVDNNTSELSIEKSVASCPTKLLYVESPSYTPPERSPLTHQQGLASTPMKSAASDESSGRSRSRKRAVGFSPLVRVRTFDAELSRIEKLSSVLQEWTVMR